MLKSNGAFRAVRFMEVVRISEGPLKGGSTVIQHGILLSRVKHEVRIRINVHMKDIMTCMHEQSYYIVHYIRRKEEGKEGRKKQTTTASKGLEKKLYMCMHSQFQQLRKIFSPTILEKYIHTLSLTSLENIYTHSQLRKIYKTISASVA